MSGKYPHVFTPLEIRGVLFKNRIWQAPPGCFFAADERGFVTDQFVEYFRQYARGGTAVCTVGNCTIDITTVLYFPGCPSAAKFALLAEGCSTPGQKELIKNM